MGEDQMVRIIQMKYLILIVALSLCVEALAGHTYFHRSDVRSLSEANARDAMNGDLLSIRIIQRRAELRAQYRPAQYGSHRNQYYGYHSNYRSQHQYDMDNLPETEEEGIYVINYLGEETYEYRVNQITSGERFSEPGMARFNTPVQSYNYAKENGDDNGGPGGEGDGVKKGATKAIGWLTNW